METRPATDATTPTKGRRRRSRPIPSLLVLIAVLAGLGLALAACGGGSSDPGVAHGAGSSSTTAAPSSGNGSSGGNNAADLEKFSECMRSHGVPAFPDPVNGHITVNGAPGSAVDPSSPQFQAAAQACKAFAPAGMTSGGPSQQEQNAYLKFASCMRSHGVPNFPDPSFSGGEVRMNFYGVDQNSPQYQSAQQACQSLLPAGSPLAGAGGS
jgi:hypothetical protein